MPEQRSIDFIRFFLRAYPIRTAALVVLLVLSGLSEGIGIVTLLPVLELSTAHSPRAHSSALSRTVAHAFGAVGLQPTLGALLASIVAGMVLKGLFRLLAMKQVGYTVARVETDTRLALISALLRSRWSYFVSQPTGKFGNAIGFESSRAAASYQNVCALLASSIQVMVYGAVAFLVSWQIAVLAIFGGAVAIAVLGQLIRVGREAGRHQAELMKSLTSRLTDALQGIKPIKAMSREHHLQPLLEAETRGINRARERQVLASEALASSQEPILVVLMAVALYFLLTYGDQPFATILVMAFLFYRLAGRISLLQTDYQAIAVGEGAFWSIRQSIESAEKHRETMTGRKAPPRLERGISLVDVRFAYGEKVVLDGVDLTIPAGRLVALVGPSGAGKTTIADLIVGLYAPTSGRVLVDDMPLDEVDLRAWRRRIGYVPQEMFLFHDTVYRNVALGDPAIDRAATREALEAAGAWEFVKELPGGLDAVLGERGSKLSGGQRQRIAIARALVHRPELLVLDEVTTALDPVTEREICATLRSLRGRVTILSVSHQPAMVEAADVVYRLDRGRATLVRPASALQSVSI